MRLVSVALVSLSITTGCTFLMKSMTPKPRIVENPLVSGQPLETTKKASLGTLAEADCETWPFEDTMSVTVTDAQICVTQHKNVEASPGWTGEPTSNSSEGFRVASGAGEGGYIDARKAKAAKVGSCFDRGYNSKVAIWAFDYKGCAPNNGTITKTSASMRVGDEAWEFSPPAGAAPAAAGPATAATP